MTTAELHEILDNPQRKLTVDELKEVVFQLKQDTFNEHIEAFLNNNWNFSQFYLGETNAFQICLDLLGHLEGDNDENS